MLRCIRDVSAEGPRDGQPAPAVPRANLWTTTEYRAQLVAAGFQAISLDEVGALTFPGYSREHCRPAFGREMRRLQAVSWPTSAT